ncbi:hypothetical protein A3D60_03460 [Candidatus Uhrbacteria bacterium RIFCSPHIGHO2_02_FULL_47_29]|uniref:Uncharacterized protein n=1 Tax=Candidatus Uhrbacteria bacterium RIFCSPLOWO2_01_FULL_47_25 TaxID=1802402 RepID=A0A1F7UWH2_9BACT|nr:MAG: hypothetical protein A2752_04570 [Candidatus Uhrbacteria bacterium RIFCSPHIGHO2_01_FULL_46_23]OGL69714.1 MAG: hypothetical protein A3D60_03460 [Candidatus Uhrbacteria bacterium RIFCSPHIGHO2_02_FULL_47_29]OGL82606.1 MAG: hypothetical protein A2936_02250 [Candidatus Uhrbacteria bacterium RIFCSPLOWO2_01_FULL_47_25]OGL86505.1 MAG: hypothetical protein A3I37_01265 [Candidatus Uhrbacteria bacterium RIFCSPLOWO2_02_FULL_46_19]
MTGEHLRKLSRSQVIFRIKCVQFHPQFDGCPETVIADFVSFYQHRINGYWGRARIIFTEWGFQRGEPLRVEVTPFLFTDEGVNSHLAIVREWDQYPTQRNMGDESAGAFVCYKNSDKVDQIPLRGLFVQLLLSRCVGILHASSQHRHRNEPFFEPSHTACFAHEIVIRLCGWLEATRQKWAAIGAV